MTYSKWLAAVLLAFVSVSALLVGVNYGVDPMQQYRITTFYPLYFPPEKERYLNAGLAKNYRYDGILLGTSHTANIFVSDVEKRLRFGRTVKLCQSGGTGKELAVTLQTAIRHNQELKHVLWGLDPLSFAGSLSRERQEQSGTFPTYLYDDDIYNDYRYLYSVETLLSSAEALLDPIIKPADDPWFHVDTMYQWQHESRKSFKVEHVLKSYANWGKEYGGTSRETYAFATLKASFDHHFLKVLESNPQIEFIIFFPPYSMLYFKVLEENGMLDDVNEFKRYIVDSLRGLPNVMLYDFQIAEGVTSDLSRYKDATHYHQKVSSWMIEQISEGRYRVSEETIEGNIRMLKAQVAGYAVPDL